MLEQEEKPEVKIAFLDVGQGDSTVIVLPDRASAVVVDCSRSAATTIDYLEGEGVTRLEYLFVTHTDVDHIGGAASLVQNLVPSIGIANNYDTPRIVNKRRRTILRQLLQLSKKHGFTTCSPRSGWRWNFQDVVIDLLHPSDHNAKEAQLNDDPNNASMILKVSYGDQRVLLAADVEGQGWQWVLDRNTDLRAEVLKFPHHGAWYNSQDRFPPLNDVLQRIDPNLVVISVGTDNQYRHPSIETLQLLRSQLQRRCLCTEATPRCHDALRYEDGHCECAGTVEVVLGNATMHVSPSQTQHGKRIESFDTPQCREEEPSAQEG